MNHLEEDLVVIARNVELLCEMLYTLQPTGAVEQQLIEVKDNLQSVRIKLESRMRGFDYNRRRG